LETTGKLGIAVKKEEQAEECDEQNKQVTIKKWFLVRTTVLLNAGRNREGLIEGICPVKVG